MLLFQVRSMCVCVWGGHRSQSHGPRETAHSNIVCLASTGERGSDALFRYQGWGNLGRGFPWLLLQIQQRLLFSKKCPWSGLLKGTLIVFV